MTIINTRILGIDYGDSRIGIAVSDPFGWTAQAVETIQQRGSLDKAVQRIQQLAKEYNVSKIVVGFPKNMNGTIGPRGEKTNEFIAQIDAAVNNCGEMEGMNKTPDAIEIIKWDERLSTVAANRTMFELGIKTTKKKGVVDQIAAVYILQGYLDSIQK